MRGHGLFLFLYCWLRAHLHAILFFFAVGAICTFLFILLARKVLFFLAAFFYFSSFHEFKIKNKLTTLKNDEILTSVLCFSTNESFFFYSRTYSRLVCYGCCMFVYFVLGTTDKYLWEYIKYLGTILGGCILQIKYTSKIS